MKLENIAKKNPRNPRRISAEKQTRLAQSLKFLGDLGGIIFNIRTGHLVGGHQRIEIIKSAKNATYETVKLPKPDKTGTVAEGYVNAFDTRFAYREVDWDETTEKIAMLAANKQGGEFVNDDVAALLNEIKDDKLFGDINLSGFSNDEFDDLKKLLHEPEKPSSKTAPSATRGKKMDRIHLTESARVHLDKCKGILKEQDDAAAIERVCKSFLL